MAKSLDAKTWFDRADGFYLAYNTLQSRGQFQQILEVLGGPATVVRAFATEAYLKCLIVLQGTVPVQTHNLLTLFDQLDQATKKELNRRWVNDCEPRVREANAANPDFTFSTSLRGALTQSSEAFREFRYAPLGRELRFGLLAFPIYVRELIREREPSWVHDSPHPLADLNEVTLPQPKGRSPKTQTQ